MITQGSNRKERPFGTVEDAKENNFFTTPPVMNKRQTLEDFMPSIPFFTLEGFIFPHGIVVK